MHSIQCPNCGLISWVTDVCKRCGQPLAAASQAGYSGQQRATYAPHAYAAAAASQQRTGLAIASMVVAIISFFTLWLLIGIPGAIVALVLGIVALCKIKRDPAQYGGRGFAIAGVAISSTVLFMLPLVAAIAIPNLLASRRAANEGSAIRTMRTLAAAEQTYQATAGQARDYGSLGQLRSAGLIDDVLGGGEKNGYRFQVMVADGKYTATAVPATAASGGRSFFIADDGVLHAAYKHGLAADQDDSPLGN